MKWYKGSFAGLAPIWVADPLGDCYVHPRGLLGLILLPVAEFMAQISIFILSILDPNYIPHFPIRYDDGNEYGGPK